MNDLQGMDLVPEPKIIIAALKACRRLNDYALAVRFLEGVKVSITFIIVNKIINYEISIYDVVCFVIPFPFFTFLYTVDSL